MPRIVDRTARQQELTQAALAVFAERGYHRATMQAVAERAGVSKGSVYDYFKSKEELLVGAAELMVGALFDQTIEVFERSTGTVHERVAGFVDGILAGVDDWAEVAMSLLQVWAELSNADDERLRKVMAELYSRSADKLQAAFDDAVARGEAAPFATRESALAIMAALDGLLLQAVMLPEEFRRVINARILPAWCASIIPAATGAQDSPDTDGNGAKHR